MKKLLMMICFLALVGCSKASGKAVWFQDNYRIDTELAIKEVDSVIDTEEVVEEFIDNSQVVDLGASVKNPKTSASQGSQTKVVNSAVTSKVTPIEVVKKNNAILDKGVERVVQEGVEGYRSSYLQRTYQGEQLIKEEEIVVKEVAMQPKIIEVGTKAKTVADSSLAYQVFTLVNNERAQKGKSSLTWSSALAQCAQTRASELEQRFDHVRPNGSAWNSVCPQNKLGGENIAYGYQTATSVMSGWMESSGHRENILRSEFKTYGTGVYKGSDGRLYWVQLFGY